MQINTENLIDIQLQDDFSLDRRIIMFFVKTGFPVGICGSKYFLDAIKIVLCMPNNIFSITTQIYDKLAEKYNTKPANIERAMRHAVDVAWTDTFVEKINDIFETDIFSTSNKLCNSELLAIISRVVWNMGIFKKRVKGFWIW